MTLVSMKKSTAQEILRAIKYALPELEDLAHCGDIKEEVSSDLFDAMLAMEDALSKS